jgi:hypothetical protein
MTHVLWIIRDTSLSDQHKSRAKKYLNFTAKTNACLQSACRQLRFLQTCNTTNITQWNLLRQATMLIWSKSLMLWRLSLSLSSGCRQNKGKYRMRPGLCCSRLGRAHTSSMLTSDKLSKPSGINTENIKWYRQYASIKISIHLACSYFQMVSREPVRLLLTLYWTGCNFFYVICMSHYCAWHTDGVGVFAGSSPLLTIGNTPLNKNNEMQLQPINLKMQRTHSKRTIEPSY